MAKSRRQKGRDDLVDEFVERLRVIGYKPCPFNDEKSKNCSIARKVRGIKLCMIGK